jgi:acetyl esterase/lipase/3-dehydroquinate dehydratase
MCVGYAPRVSQLPLLEVTVLAGPVPDLDPAWLESRLATWAEQIGVDARLVRADDEDAALDALAASGARAGGVVLVPGTIGTTPRLVAAAEASARPLIWLDLAAATSARPSHLHPVSAWGVHGRGIDGLRWALRHLLERTAWPLTTHMYGDDPEQRADLRLPSGPGRHPVAALVHGGYWRDQWQREIMDALAVDLVRRGYATWNIEYRRVGPSGGGWPGTFVDISRALAALGQLARTEPLDVGRLAIVGHSAGGHLAAWAASRGRPPTVPGIVDGPTPALVVSLAGVLDLTAAGRRGIGDLATWGLLDGSTEQQPARYEATCPASRLPSGVPHLIAIGTADNPDLVDSSLRFCARAAHEGEEAELLELPGADHFAVIEPRSEAWKTIAARLEERLPPRAVPEAT